MEEHDSLSVAYETRRQARGAEPPKRPHLWRKRLIIGGAVFLCLAAVVVAFWVWWILTHVTTARAGVWASVVAISPEVDARMAELFVEPGQKVSKGQALARLDDSQLRAALAAADAGQAIKQSQYAQAEAHCRVVEAQMEADVELARARVAIADARVARAKAAFELYRARLPEEIRRAKALRDQGRARLARLKKGPRTQRIEAARARLATARALAELYALELQKTAELVKERVESQLTFQVKKTQLAAQSNEVREAELTLEQLLAGATDEEIDDATEALLAREAALALAHVGVKEEGTLAADLAIREAERREAGAALERAQAMKHEVALAREQVKQAEAELKRAEADVTGRRAALAGMTIVSPVAGTVHRTFDSVGEVCRKGLPTVLVCDDSAGRWVEGFVTERDASLVRLGQRAEIEIQIGSGNYVDAEVEAVGMATSSLSRPNAGDSGSLSPPAAGGAELVWVKFRPLGQEAITALPGMTARAVIRVR